jgi:hypothetical protein
MNLTSDTTNELETFAGQFYLLTLAGDFGGGTITVNAILDDDSTAPLIGPITVEGTYIVPISTRRTTIALAGSADPYLTAAFVLSTSSFNPYYETPAKVAAQIAAAMKGVIVSKASGTRTAYAPSADTDTARGLALEAAFAAAVAGDTIDLSAGNYYVAKSTSTIMGYISQFGILDGMTIRLNGARLYKKSTDTASSMFTTDGTRHFGWQLRRQQRHGSSRVSGCRDSDQLQSLPTRPNRRRDGQEFRRDGHTGRLGNFRCGRIWRICREILDRSHPLLQRRFKQHRIGKLCRKRVLGHYQ